jgi:hypothetical protein
MANFVIAWQAPASIGGLPQHPGDGENPHFTVDWVPKRSATYYPFGPFAPEVDPSRPEEPPPASGHGAGGGGTTAPPPPPSSPHAPPPPVVRGHKPRLSVLARRDPRQFRRHGLPFTLALDAPGRVTAVLVTSAGKKLTYTARKHVGKGSHRITLRTGDLGRLATLRHGRLAARLEITIHYDDGSHGTLRRAIVLAAAAHSR